MLFARLGDAAACFKMVEIAVSSQGSAGADDGALLRAIRFFGEFGIEEVFAK